MYSLLIPRVFFSILDSNGEVKRSATFSYQSNFHNKTEAEKEYEAHSERLNKKDKDDFATLDKKWPDLNIIPDHKIRTLFRAVKDDMSNDAVTGPYWTAEFRAYCLEYRNEVFYDIAYSAAQKKMSAELRRFPTAGLSDEEIFNMRKRNLIDALFDMYTETIIEFDKKQKDPKWQKDVEGMISDFDDNDDEDTEIYMYQIWIINAGSWILLGAVIYFS